MVTRDGQSLKYGLQVPIRDQIANVELGPSSRIGVLETEVAKKDW